MEKNIDWEFRAKGDNASLLSMLALLGCCSLPFIIVFIGDFFTGYMESFAFIIVTLGVILLAAFVVFSSEISVVNANKDNVTIKNILCKKVVSVKKYEYSDIESAECHVVQASSRNSHSICYGMWVKIKLKNGKTLKYDKPLDISGNLHRIDLKKYTHLVESEDMFRLCAFINDIKAKQNNDGNAQ